MRSVAYQMSKDLGDLDNDVAACGDDDKDEARLTMKAAAALYSDVFRCSVTHDAGMDEGDRDHTMPSCHLQP